MGSIRARPTRRVVSAQAALGLDRAAVGSAWVLGWATGELRASADGRSEGVSPPAEGAPSHGRSVRGGQDHPRVSSRGPEGGGGWLPGQRAGCGRACQWMRPEGAPTEDARKFTSAAPGEEPRSSHGGPWRGWAREKRSAR